MWCVVHVRDRNEEDTESFIEGLLQGRLNVRCFHLTRSRRKKYRGEWQTVHENLFPGYVFIDTDQPDKVYRELKKVPKPKLMFSDDEYVSTLEPQEFDLMKKLTDKNGHIGISTIKLVGNGKIEYLSGPLVNIGDKVRRVNLHKRIAELETNFMGRRQILYLGIEVERAWDECGM